MKFTTFKSVASPALTEHDLPWLDLLAILELEGTHPTKDACPLVKLATFGNKAGKASLRNNANVTSMTGITGDYDGEAISMEDAIDMCYAHNIKAAIYPSPRYTPEKPRWRILAPFDKPVPPDQYGVLVSRLNGVLGGCLASESWTLSQPFYYGATLGNQEWYKIVTAWEDDRDEGHCLDSCGELDALSIPRPQASKKTGSGRHGNPIEWDLDAKNMATGSGRREMLKSIIGVLSAEGKTQAEILEEVERVVAAQFDPTDPPDWKNVRKIIADYWEKDTKSRQESTKPLEPDDLYEVYTAEQVKAIPVMREIIRGVFPQKGLGCLFGETQAGKSFLALHMAACVAEGSEFFGARTIQTPVLLICLEGEHALSKRIKAWEKANNRKLPAGVHITTGVLAQTGNKGFLVLNMADAERMGATAAGVGAKMVIIDTFHRATVGIDENSSQGMGEALRGMSAVQKMIDGLVVFVHHPGKDLARGMRGSNALKAAVDGGVDVTVDKDGYRKWSSDKSKDWAPTDSKHFDLQVFELGSDEYGDPITSCAVMPSSRVDPPEEEKTRPPRGAKAKTMLRHIAKILEVIKTLPMGTLLDALGDGYGEKSDAKRVVDRLIEQGYLDMDLAGGITMPV